MLTLAVAVLATSTVTMRYDQFAGLTVELDGARLIAGSAFQYYEPGWKGGIYSSRWSPKTVVQNGREITVRFQGKGGDVLGTLRYRLEDTALTAHYDFGWNGDREVRIENCFGLLWASAFKDATADADRLHRTRFSDVPFASQDLARRALVQDTQSLEFEAPFGQLALTSERPFIVYDGRNLEQDWARGRPVHWAGALEHAIAPGARIAYSVTWRFSRLVDRPPATERVSGIAATIPEAQTPYDPGPLVPRPRSLVRGAGRLRVAGGLACPGFPELERLLGSLVASRWLVEQGPALAVQVVRSDNEAPCYWLDVNEHGVTLRASKDEALRMGVARLAQLLASDEQGLYLPHVAIANDAPRVPWRGVHLFVGPRALEYQRDLALKVLVPLGFNGVVLQCERTAWESLPGIETDLTMSKEDLAGLFAMYRGLGIEPVPLIQSLGHMEWFFANGQNLGLAVNPSTPYTLDARRKEAREAIVRVWEEAIALLRPQSVHFGLDEIGARGMNDDSLATRLWNTQLPTLMDIAKKHGLRPMLWGDMALAKQEANGVASAPSLAVAAERRRAIREGATVLDWQYATERDPSKYRSLGVWPAHGLKAIAAGSHRPDNVYGLARAAKDGYLQTTWSGYESSTLGAARDLAHVAAYLLAAEYSWGHQPEPPEGLPYNPQELARRLLFEGPQPVRARGGLSLLANAGPEYKVGQYKFRGRNLIELRSVVSGTSQARPTGVIVGVGRPATQVSLAVDCFAWMEYGDPVATVRVRTADGRTVSRTLHYGFDVRAADDPNPTAVPRSGAISAVTIVLGGRPEVVTEIEVQRASAAAGLRVQGITLT